MSKLKSLNLNSLQLKVIGFVMTLVGAVGITFFSGEGQEHIRLVLEFISYPAIAIFTFLLVEGYLNTGSLKKYATGLILTAVMTEPFYDYACIGSWLDYGSANGQNFLFALLLCMFVLELLRWAEQSQKYKWFMVASLVAAIPFWAIMTNIRFSGISILMTVIFCLLEKKPMARFWVALVSGTALQYTGGLAAAAVHFYNGERGSYNKYLFYGLYPALWMILALVKFFA